MADAEQTTTANGEQAERVCGWLRAIVRPLEEGAWGRNLPRFRSHWPGLST